MGRITPFLPEGSRSPGNVISGSFELEVQEFMALNGGPDAAKAGRVMQAMLQMSKLDVAGLQAAANA